MTSQDIDADVVSTDSFDVVLIALALGDKSPTAAGLTESKLPMDDFITSGTLDDLLERRWYLLAHIIDPYRPIMTYL